MDHDERRELVPASLGGRRRRTAPRPARRDATQGSRRSTLARRPGRGRAATAIARPSSAARFLDHNLRGRAARSAARCDGLVCILGVSRLDLAAGTVPGAV